MSIDTLLSGNMHVIALAGDVSSQIRPSPNIQRASRDVPENRLVHEQHAPVAESPKSPLKTQSQGEIKGTYKRTCARIHARVRYPRDVGSEAQFFVRANEGEFRLGPHCPDGRWGHIRAELPVGSWCSDGPVGFAGPYGGNLMQAPPRIRGRIRVLLRDLGVAD